MTDPLPRQSIRAEIREVCKRCGLVLGSYPSDRPAYYSMPASECPNCQEQSR